MNLGGGSKRRSFKKKEGRLNTPSFFHQPQGPWVRLIGGFSYLLGGEGSREEEGDKYFRVEEWIERRSLRRYLSDLQLLNCAEVWMTEGEEGGCVEKGRTSEVGQMEKDGGPKRKREGELYRQK